MFDNAALTFSNEVHIEIMDHQNKGIEKIIQNKKLVRHPSRQNIDSYEQRLLSKRLPSRAPGGSKGEVDNYIVAVDLSHHLKRGITIYISDDEKALNGTLSDWKLAFPCIHFWTSCDVVLFLYANNIIPSKDIARDMIKDILSVSAPPQEKRSVKTTGNIVNRTVKYNSLIDKIYQLFN
ncbi:hypothetical protein [Siphonobacter aquaeclarae]|uniref:hypothetical protein n=1 Tax=Siphonobacter aquaeclarae TaxID=563176 RepID=UPI001C40A792|nr:hypothetical protein [Siphonobacter aquaeclarae]